MCLRYTPFLVTVANFYCVVLYVYTICSIIQEKCANHSDTMLAAPIMPTPPSLLSPKRRLCNRLYDVDTDGLYMPKAKRPRLCSGNYSENGVILNCNDKHIGGVLPCNGLFPHVIKRSASIRAREQLSNLFKEDQSTFTCNGFSLQTNGILCSNNSSRVRDVKQVSVVDDKIPVVNLKTSGVPVSESTVVHKVCTFSTEYTSSSDVDSDCSESNRTSIPKSKMKQPSIVLMKLNQPKKKKPASPSPRPVSPMVSSVVVGGYVHRMASLNARACVAAYLEPDKKYAPKSANKSVCKTTATIKATGSNQSLKVSSDLSIPEMKPKPIEVSNSQNVDNLEVSVHIGNVGSEDGNKESVDEVPYNKEGLLYNGDTLHPNAQVFRTGIPDLCLPTRVVPTLVPTRLSTVKRAADKACMTGIVHCGKKLNKVSFGITI